MSLRVFIKRSVKRLFLLVSLPLFGMFLVISKLSGSDKCFSSFSQVLSLVPGRSGVYLRAAFYHLVCPETSDEISVGFLSLLSHRNTSIARGVYIGPQCNIGMCSIGENTLLGSGVHVLSGSRQHEFSDVSRPIQEQGGNFERITIGQDCWVGNQAVVMSSIESKCIVAAGSVVTTPTPAGDIVAGNPARRLRNRFTDSQSPTMQKELN